MTITRWHIRPATPSDLEALTWIAINAFPEDPQWHYRYPYAADFPDDHFKNTRRRYAQWLEASITGKCTIRVAECPSLEDPSVLQVVALSIWRFPKQEIDTRDDGDAIMKPPETCNGRRDANLLHMKAFRAASDLVTKKYFEQRFGVRHLGLVQLATHPSYSRRGAATQLVKWGLDLATIHSWPVTLFSGPAAYHLYQRHGFKQIVMVTAQVQDEAEFVQFPGMIWEPQQKDLLLEQEWFQEGVPGEVFILDPKTMIKS